MLAENMPIISLNMAAGFHYEQAQNLCISAIDLNKIEQIGFLNFLGFLRFFELEIFFI